MPFNTRELLTELIKSPLKSFDIQKGLEEAQVSENKLTEYIMTCESNIWNSVLSELEELKLSEFEIDKFKSSNPILYQYEINGDKILAKRGWILALILGLISVLVFFTPVAFDGNLTNWVNSWFYELFKSGGFKRFAGLSLYALLFSISYRLLLFVRERLTKRVDLKTIKSLQATHSLELEKFKQHLAKVNNLKLLITKNLEEKSIKELMRAFINERLTPSYDLNLSNIQVNGLGEVLDVKRSVDTKAKQKLDFLLQQMPGGSIGIAGSRGAGKSTLIHTYCGSGRTVTAINNRQIISVLSSAPVQYDSREFILHLFATTCLNALNEERKTRPNDFLDEERENRLKNSRLLNSLSQVFPRLFYYLFGIGFFLVFFSFSIFMMDHKLPIQRTRPSVPTTDTMKRDTTRLRNVIDSNFIKHEENEITKTNDIQAAVDRLTLDYLLMLFPKSGTATNAKLGWFFLILGSILLIFKRKIWFVRDALLIKERREKTNKMRDDSKDRISIKAEAESWLKKIKFQQTFTDGWTGSLKLPIGVETSSNKVITMAEKPLTNPEIMEGFSSFLNILSLEYQIIIGIDEMDKLASEADAQKFLNEIKSIFGVPRCFFLISVSENAMNNFERRGMPFRDVFDSSFDCIVYVDYLSLDICKLLLQRRVIGRPMPFFCLAYCFAGGLPRDIIRYFREIYRVSEMRSGLHEITSIMVMDDLEAKMRAIFNALRKVEWLPETDIIFGTIFEIQQNLTIGSLETSIEKLQAIWEIINTRTDISSEQRPTYNLLLSLTEELITFLAYQSTLWTIFTENLTPSKMRRLDTDGIFEQLVKARQAIAIDFMIAKKIISNCRKIEKMLDLQLLNSHHTIKTIKISPHPQLESGSIIVRYT